MAEQLYQWNYVIAAYFIGVTATLALIGWTVTAMKSSEARRDKAKERR
jgi:hypothetical protein